MVKFMWNGIKVDGKLYKAWYSPSNSVKFLTGTITIYAKDYYPHFPKIEGLNIENNSDIMTDYHEKDRIRVTPENKFYKEVLTAYKLQEKHNQKIRRIRMSLKNIKERNEIVDGIIKLIKEVWV